MASVYETIKAEVDAAALRYKELKNKQSLTHREEKTCQDCLEKIATLLLTYARMQNTTEKTNIYKENKHDTDNLELWKLIQNTLNIFINNEEKTYYNLFCFYFGRRKPGIVKGYLGEIRQQNNKLPYKEISLNDEENLKNLNEAATKLNKDAPIDSFDAFDRILKITREETLKENPKFEKYIIGFWTIKFIEQEIGKIQAKIWEIYIFLAFFMQNEGLSDKHAELMELMAIELGKKKDTWRKLYKKAYDNICRYVVKLRILK